MHLANRTTRSLAVLGLLFSSGCAILFPETEPGDSTIPCQIALSDRLALLPVDGRWTYGDLDCPTTGLTSIAYTPDLRTPQLAALEVEVLEGSADLAVFVRSEQGDLFRYEPSANAPTRVEVPSTALTPRTAVFVASGEPLRFRIRRKTTLYRPARPSRPAPRIEPATPVARTPDAADAPDATSAPATPPAPAPKPTLAPGVVLVDARRPSGDPVRQLELERGRSSGLRVGQTGRIVVGDTTATRFCIEDTSAGTSRARLARPVAASIFGDPSEGRIEVAAHEARPLKILRISGDPVDELELSGGERNCLQSGMTGRLETDEGTIATFRLGRIVSSRAWAILDAPVDRARASRARVVLDLGRPAGD